MMHQQKIRVVYIKNYPKVSDECTEFPALSIRSKCSFPGLMVEILNLIANALNLKIEPIIIDYLDYNKANSSDSLKQSLNDAFELMQQGKAETVAMGFYKTEIRSNNKNFSFSSELYREQTRFIMLQNSIYTSIWSFFRIFDSNTWLTILLALIIQCSLCVLIRKTEFYMNSNNSVGVLESFWQMLRLQLLQPEAVHFKTKAGKVSIICFSLIQCAVLFGVFSSWILSNILSSGHTVPINSDEQLLKKLANNEFSLVTHSMAHWFFDNIKQSQTYRYADIRLAIQKNPIKITGSSEETISEILKGRAITFVEDDLETYFNSIAYCGIVEFSQNMPIISQRLLFLKNSPFLNDVNRVIYENKMLILRIKRKYLEDLKERIRPVCVQPFKPIGIVPYLGLVIICVSIFLFAVFILLCEIGIAMKFGVRSQNNIVSNEIEDLDNMQKQIQFKNATTKMLLARRNTQDRRELKRCKRSRAKCIIVANIIRSK